MQNHLRDVGAVDCGIPKFLALSLSPFPTFPLPNVLRHLPWSVTCVHARGLAGHGRQGLSVYITCVESTHPFFPKTTDCVLTVKVSNMLVFTLLHADLCFAPSPVPLKLFELLINHLL